MKIIVAALALAVAAASPALAQSNSKNRQLRDWQRSESYYSRSDRRPHSPNPQWDVYRNDGSYAGSDPDPSVRRNLYRDNPFTDD